MTAGPLGLAGKDGRLHLRVLSGLTPNSPNQDGSPWYARTLPHHHHPHRRRRPSSSRSSSSCSGSPGSRRLGGYPVSLFLEMDPLVGFATALSTHTVYRWLWRGLFILVPDAAARARLLQLDVPVRHAAPVRRLGLQHPQQQGQHRQEPLPAALPAQVRDPDDLPGDGGVRLAADRPARSDLPAGADLHRRTSRRPRTWRSELGASPERGLDPRWLVAPQARRAASSASSPAPGSSALLILGLVGMNLVIPRFFCRVLCPLGAFLGWLSRFALWRIDRDLTKCTDCNLCLKHCEGACRPAGGAAQERVLRLLQLHRRLPGGRALVQADARCRCKDRIVGAIKEGTATLFGSKVISKLPETEIARARPCRAAAGSSRRIAGVLAFPFLRLSRGGEQARLQREGDPAAGLGRRGRVPRALHQVRPVHQRLPDQRAAAVDARRRRASRGCGRRSWTSASASASSTARCAARSARPAPSRRSRSTRSSGSASTRTQGPIRLGTAFFDQGRCLPWAMETPCVVCEEVCPVSPKAIGTYDEEITRWDGDQVTLNKPYMRPGAVHRLRHLRARVPGARRRRGLRHRHRRDALEGSLAAADEQAAPEDEPSRAGGAT